MSTTTPRTPQVGDQWRFKNDVVEVVEFIPALDHFGGVSAVRYAWLTEIDVDPAIRDHSSREEGRLIGLARAAEFVRTATLVVAASTATTGVDTYDCPEPGCDFNVSAVGPQGPDDYHEFNDEIDVHERGHGLAPRRGPAVLEPPIRPFEPGNPVLVDDGAEGRVASVHDGYVWVSVKDPMVNTGWRPANGYYPADVQHARPFQVDDQICVTPRSQDDISGLWTITAIHPVDETGNLIADLIATGGTLHGVIILNPDGTGAARDGYTIELLASGHAETASVDDTTPTLVQLDPDDVGHRVIAAALAFDELDDRREGLDVAGVDAWDTAREGLRQALADFREVNR